MSSAASWQVGAAEAARSLRVYDDALRWLATAAPPVDTPIAVEVWVLTPDLTRVLLVRHRWRRWVPPGGKVDHGEDPRAAAAREVREETGLVARLGTRPAAVAVRSFRADWTPTLALSYWAVAPETTVVGEPGQPAAWVRLDAGWDGFFPEDAARIRDHAARLARPTSFGADPL